MNVHVLLNLVKEFEIGNEFKKFNNPGFYLSYDIKIILKSIFFHQTSRFSNYVWKPGYLKCYFKSEPLVVYLF